MGKLTPEELLSRKDRAAPISDVDLPRQLAAELYDDLFLRSHQNFSWEMRAEYFCIKLVSLLEQFTRKLVSDLIDEGDVEDEGVEKVLNRLSVNWGVVRGIVGKEFSLGEVAALTLNVSRLSDFFAVVEPLVPGLKNRLETVTELWSDIPSDRRIIDSVDDNLKVIANLFEARNAIVHDLGSPILAMEYDVDEYYVNVDSFMTAGMWILTALTTGPVPRTQEEMNRRKQIELNSVRERFDDTLERYCAASRMSQAQGQELRLEIVQLLEKQASIDASFAGGGSTQPLISAQFLIELLSAYTTHFEESMVNFAI